MTTTADDHDLKEMTIVVELADTIGTAIAAQVGESYDPDGDGTDPFYMDAYEAVMVLVEQDLIRLDDYTIDADGKLTRR